MSANDHVSDAQMLEQVGVRLLSHPRGAYDPRRVQQVIRAYHGPRSVATLDEYWWVRALDRSLSWDLDEVTSPDRSERGTR